MSGPPKMRLPYAPTRLQLVSSTGAAAADVAPSPVRKGPELMRGVAYAPAQWREWLGADGTAADPSSVPEAAAMDADRDTERETEADCSSEKWIAGFRMGLDGGACQPLQTAAPAFCWDEPGADGICVRENEFQLLAASVEALAIEPGIGCALLSITPRFSVSYGTHAFAARLGEIRLVSASRFITDPQGNRHSLLETEAAGAPVLYRDDADDNQVIRQLTDWQSQGSEQHYRFDYRISQVLKRELLGVEVQSITVLEHYSSYFMQRAITAHSRDAMWVPAFAPINWGWSLRVEPEADDWVITRRKLIVPVVSHDGWQMPRWCGNTVDYLSERARNG